jgi:hypothetical protein
MQIANKLNLIKSYIVFKSYVNKLVYKALPVGTKRQRKSGWYQKQQDGTWTKIKQEKTETKKESDIKSKQAPDAKQLNNSAINHFGLTNDIYEAGYILDNGKMLDFSGKRQGGDPGERVMDHREVEGIPGFKKKKKGQESSENMMQFVDDAKAVRIDAAKGLVNSVGVPSDNQISAILHNIKKFSDGDSIVLEIDNEKGDTIDSAEIDNPRVKDIMDFYNKHKNK